MRLRVLDRYLMKGYLSPFLACLGIFCILVMLGRYFDKMGTFNTFHAKPLSIASYLMLSLPFWLNTVMPVATLLALLFSLGALQQRGEITAMRSAGISSIRLFAPYFVIGLLLAGVSLFGGLTFLPELNFKSRVLYREVIKNQEVLSYRRDNVVAAGHDNRQFTIGWVDLDNNRLAQVVMDKFDKDLVWEESVSAREAKYVNGRWLFVKGLRRKVSPDGQGIAEEKFEEWWVDMRERPRDFVVENKEAQHMNGHELRRRIKRLKQLGVKTKVEQTAYHLRIALPFANVVVIALGIPFAVRQGRRGRVQTFAYALFASFLYWGCVSVFESLGDQGHVPPLAAAWMANALFGVVAVFLFRKEI